MDGVVGWALARPAGRARAVVLCLHGRGEDHRFAFERIGVHRFAAAARLPFAIVGVDGGSSSYWHHRETGVDPEAMVFDELLPAVRAELGDVPIFLLGWSMGGYGALLGASDHLGHVAAVAVASPAIWPSFAKTAPGAFDGPADFAAHDILSRVSTLRRLPTRIECGSGDPFIRVAMKLARELGAESSFSPGFHDAGYWRSRVRGQLEFFRRALDRL